MTALPVLVTTRESQQVPQEPILLQPGHYPAREGLNYGRILPYSEIPAVIQQLSDSPIVAVDLETTGLAYHTGSVEIVGMGLAWNTGSCYIPWTALYQGTRDSVFAALSSHSGLIAHNVYYDAGVLRMHGCSPKFHMCTRALLALIANEGYPGQTSALKPAQVSLLGWGEQGDVELDRWLVSHGLYKGNRRLSDDVNYLLTEFSLGKLQPDKGQMFRAPVEILGKYCILDAESTYLLYTKVLFPILQDFPDLEKFTREELMYLIDLGIDQKIIGMEVDSLGLRERAQFLEQELSRLEGEFRQHADVSPYIQASEAAARDLFLSTAPAQFRKDGGVSKNWVKWEEKLRKLDSGLLPEYRFNIQSGPQLRELLYAYLQFEVRSQTETGAPAVGVKSLKHMGEVGRILVDHSYARKELGYIQDYIERTIDRPTIHPDFRLPGTMTGRLSSSNPNLQQIPKSKAVMSLFRARPGHVWIDLDFSALEPVVATEFSQDPNMMRIYGNGVPTNDIYLFVSANIPTYRSEVLATGYDPYNPTPESLARAKKECKRIRSICKTVVLACQYGAGVNKVMQTLEEDNVFLSYEEVESIHSGYWNLFSGLRVFSRKLYGEWRKNGGWILNGLGRPMCVPGDMTKDLLNRFVQSTGHDILVKYIRIYTEELARREILYNPICLDWHDASCIEVLEEDRERAIEVFNWGIDELNRQLGGIIRLRGEPDVGYNMADVKRPED